jgi:muramoyltetrapeptide carboxypeptidase
MRGEALFPHARFAKGEWLVEAILPKALKKGDAIGVVAPASPPDLARIEKAKSLYEDMGLRVLLAPSVGKRHGYLGGTDAERVADLESMFANEDVRGVFCACGGYGTPRIVDRLNYKLIAEHPKVFWGYSDITCLHVAIHQQTGLVTFHGPMLSSDLGNSELEGTTLAGLSQIMAPRQQVFEQTRQPLHVLAEGMATGKLVGGNLTLLASMIGTPYEIDTKDTLLFIEEIEEEPYRIDRMLNQLRLAGKLDDAAGFVIGNFNGCEPKKRQHSFTLQEVLDDYFSGSGKPCISGFQIGHCSPAFSVPYGARAVLDTERKRLVVEAGVRGEGQ